MNTSTSFRLVLAAAVLALAPLASAGAPAKAAACADCHGKDGNSTTAEIPSIAGISAMTHEDNMASYKDKARPCAKVKFASGNHPAGATDDMCSIASKLSDEEVSEIAAYYAGQKFVPFKNTVDAAKAAAGKKYFDTNCVKCHTKGGSVADDDAGILAGQPKAYLVQAFKELRAGEREMLEKKAPKIKALKDPDVEAVVEFLAGGGK